MGVARAHRTDEYASRPSDTSTSPVRRDRGLTSAYACAHNALVQTTKPVRKYHKLTDFERNAIRLQYEAGARQVDLAEAFNVNQATISRTIRSGKEEAA